MKQLPGLHRDLALVLVSTTKTTRSATEDPFAKQLLQVFLRLKPTRRELSELRSYCSEMGAACWDSATRYYQADPVYQGAAEIADELLLGTAKRQQEAQDHGDAFDDDRATQELRDAADGYQEQLRLRDRLRDEYGLESAADWRMMVEAMRCSVRAYRGEWQRGDRQALRDLTREARRLLRKAQSMNSTPQVVADWEALMQNPSGMKPNVIYRRPDGISIWGDRALVVWDKDGNPCRPMDTIFGKVMAEGSVPLDYEMEDMVRRAWGTEEK